MPERLPERPLEEHPIAAGLIALVGVGVVVGLVLGLVVFAGTKVLGLGGGSEESGVDGHATMYLPTPVKTTASSDPQITLAPGVGPSNSDVSPSESPSESPEREITLSASVTEVSPMQQFELTGVYPQGEGAILTVQRFEGGGWVDFPATGSVAGEQFQIPVQASLPGVNRFRVVDSDSGLKSGEVRVTITG
ncbi:hypothetical protein [Nocardioides soli]|uniref:Uncharacterized protein n=1 Tax=Nocardioides soli TaxID=1036020 RepID=A0A7W4W1J9_9ACTN|nr:hypothetical protein [Nocardioides soli]MBB3045237.1 hypothetical protein [Nocardioides soli]